MATHSSVHAWRIPGTGEPGGLPSMGSHRVGHDSNDLAAAAAENFLQISQENMSKEFLFFCLIQAFFKYKVKRYQKIESLNFIRYQRTLNSEY